MHKDDIQPLSNFIITYSYNNWSWVSQSVSSEVDTTYTHFPDQNIKDPDFYYVLLL